MQVFNTGSFFFFSAYYLSDPNADPETKSDKSKKVNKSPHIKAKPSPLGVVSSHAGINIRAVDRKHPQKM